jgi:hypothetical protein
MACSIEKTDIVLDNIMLNPEAADDCGFDRWGNTPRHWRELVMG